MPLEKRGASYWGCCPFHHEKTPSFSVHNEKQFYHCFGCRESGNAFTFIKKIENVEFGDALKILAKRAGLEIPQRDGFKKDDADTLKRKERLYALMREAARHYHENLSKPEAAAAKAYLSQRGISGSLITKFGLGYSLNGSEMLTHLGSKGYTDAEMKDAGILAVSENGTYDVFYDRLIVPIINQFGEVVAFGGRTLIKNPDFAKYRNSSQTLIFDKSKTLYAVNLLQKQKQKQRAVPYIILCEGYMDVIALHAYGFDTAVASMGTSLTYAQAKQLKNFGTNRVYISYDGDTAGQRAALRGLDILDETGLNVRVIIMPDGIDPDDAVRKHGAAYYQKLLDQALPLPAFKIETLKKQYDLTDSQQKAQFAVEAAKVAKALTNPVEQEDYLKLIQTLTGYSLETLYRQTEIAPPPLRTETQAEEKSAEAPSKISAAKQFVLAAVAANKPYVDYSASFDFLTDEFSRTAITYFLTNRKEKQESTASLYEMIDETFWPSLGEIQHYPFTKGNDTQKYYTDCVYELKRTALQAEHEYLTRLAEKTSVPSEKLAALQKIQEINLKIQQLKHGGEE